MFWPERNWKRGQWCPRNKIVVPCIVAWLICSTEGKTSENCCLLSVSKSICPKIVKSILLNFVRKFSRKYIYQVQRWAYFCNILSRSASTGKVLTYCWTKLLPRFERSQQEQTTAIENSATDPCRAAFAKFSSSKTCKLWCTAKARRTSWAWRSNQKQARTTYCFNGNFSPGVGTPTESDTTCHFMS